MKNELLHVFRNTPFGRETFLQSLYFCKTLRLKRLAVYIPVHSQFLMYYPQGVVTVDLDKSFLRSPETAREHAEALIREAAVEARFLEPKSFTASTLPEIPVDFDFMCLPRTISDLSSKVGLGFIGPRVRTIIKNAEFPVLIPTPVYKEWKSVVVFFGGSDNALNATRLGLRLHELSGLPMRLFTHATKWPREYYEETLATGGIPEEKRSEWEWIFAEDVPFREALYAVPHDALVIVGAYGHGLVKELLFGSTMEEVQSVLPNNMVIVGPRYRND